MYQSELFEKMASKTNLIHPKPTCVNLLSGTVASLNVGIVVSIKQTKPPSAIKKKTEKRRLAHEIYAEQIGG